MTPDQVTTLRVLVASPSDVQAERQIARLVIDQINQAFRDQPVRLTFVGWEDASPGFGNDPQDVINRQIGDDYDVFVGILWTRFGTQTPRADSGTEEEFQRAYQRWRTDQHSVDIMLFFSDVPMPPRSDAHQLARVQEFRDSVSSLGGLYCSFSDRDEFRNLLHVALTRRVLREISPEPPGRAASPTSEEKAAGLLPSEPLLFTDVHISPDVVRDLSKEDAYIITHPLSHQRIRAFYDEFLKDREQAASCEKVFGRAKALTVSNNWKDEVATGFNVILHRGPFVEGSNWLPYRTWQFAVSAEQNLLNRFDSLLQVTVASGGTSTGLNWKDIFAKVGSLREHLEKDGYSPSLIVVTGRLPTDLMVDLHNHAVPDWELTAELRAPWIEGTYDGIPILNIRDDDTRYALFVVDLREFATLTRYSPGAKLTIRGIDHERAQEVLAKRPDAVKLPDDRPDTQSERILQLLLRVHVLMYESCAIIPGNSAAAAGTRLAPPQGA